MFVNLNIKSVGELVRNHIHSFMNRLQCSKDLQLSYICKSTMLLYMLVLVGSYLNRLISYIMRVHILVRFKYCNVGLWLFFDIGLNHCITIF